LKTATKIITNKIQSNLITNLLTSYTNVLTNYTYSDSLEQENPQVHCAVLVLLLHACLASIHSPDDVFMAR